MRADVVTLDFETEGIRTRPSYPPKPVGVAIEAPGEKPEYLAWGHPTENNCSREFAARRLKQVGWRASGATELLFHHGKFDLDVGQTHLGLPAVPWRRTHDTLFVAFLEDPHSPSLSLKPLAERHLGLKPVERDAVRDWILANVPEATPKDWGAYISRAPGKLVGRYAVGDVVRTRKLFRHLHDRVVRERAMGAAYDRERQLLPILLESERGGLRVYHEKLRRDVRRFGGAREADGVYRGGLIGEVDAKIRRILRAPELDVDKKEQLADALERAGAMGSWKTTATGKRSVAKESIEEGLTDKRLLALLLYRGAVATCVRTFMGKWLAQADVTGGVIHVNWNQVRQSHNEGPTDAGARTGRLSSNPNLQNVPTKKSPNYARVMAALKAARLTSLEFPMVRSYLAPDTKADVFLDRDYSQQELRILGHYEGAVLMDRYNDEPWLDVHDLALVMINDMLGTRFSRRQVKDVGFGLIYGMGLPKLALKVEAEKAVARRLKDAYLAIFPGLKDLDDDLKERAIANLPIRTWGGREYFVEPPRFSKKFGRMQTFGYKLLNTLIQGSAGDNTKQSIINYHDHPKRDARFLLTVHDQNLASCAKRIAVPQMRVLREAMEDVKFDVPMLSEGEWGTNWAAMKPFDVKGKDVYRGLR